MPDTDSDPDLGMDICPKNGHSNDWVSGLKFGTKSATGTVTVQYNVAIGSETELLTESVAGNVTKPFFEYNAILV